MSIRNLLLNILIAIFLAFVLTFIAVADSLPMWLLGIAAVVVWVIYVVLVIRDHQRDIKYPVIRYRPTELPAVRTVKPPQTTVYDQKEEE